MSWKLRAYAALSRRLPADVLLDSVTCVRGDFRTPKALDGYRADLWTARACGVAVMACYSIGGGVNFGVFFGELRYHYVWGPEVEAQTVTLPGGSVSLDGRKANGQFLQTTFGFRF